MLVDRLGRLVWFKPAAQGQKPFDLKVQTYKGKPVLTWWEGPLIADFGSGKAQIADATFNTIKTVSAANGLTMDLHEFTITSSGAGLATAYHETTTDLTAVKGAKQGRIVDLPRAGARSGDRQSDVRLERARARRGGGELSSPFRASARTCTTTST